MGQEMVASHVPLLTRIFTLSKGDVLEVGTGYFSTLILKWLAELSHRNVYSYENREYWYKKAKRNQSQYLKLFFCPDQDYNSAPFERDQRYGLIFVDSWPNGKRIEVIKRLANMGDYIVIHDTNEDGDKSYHYSQIWDLFKYRYDFNLYYPPTTVVSNFKPLGKVK